MGLYTLKHQGLLGEEGGPSSSCKTASGRPKLQLREPKTRTRTWKWAGTGTGDRDREGEGMVVGGGEEGRPVPNRG